MMNIHQKKINNNNNKINSPNDINIISPLSALESRKVLYFQKINSMNDINTYGSQPVIVYKKELKSYKSNQKSPNVFHRKNSKNLKNDINKYISDGNLTKKLQKFNSSSNIQNYQNKNIKFKKNKSCTGNIVLMEQDNKIKEEKERKKNIKEQKLFSKTVRESNMRPAFPKNKNKQFNLTNNGFNHKFNINKEKEKEKQNMNINKENTKEEELKKNIIMKQLVENAVAIEIKKYQNVKNKNTINNKKREILEENGFSTISNEETTDKDKNDEIQQNQEKGKKNNSNILITKHNNYISPNLIHKNMSNEPLKSKNKPPVEQFEFLLKIKEEQKKLNLSSKKTNNNFNSYNNIGNIMNGYPNKTEDSFRKKNKRIYEERNKIKNDKDENSYSYFLEDKKNHRSSKEINEYLREKKIKYRQNEESKQLERNKKLFLRFKNLYNLNMKDYKEITDINKQKMPINYNNKQKIIKNVNDIHHQIEERKDDIINPNTKKNTDIYPNSNKNSNFNSYITNKMSNQNNNNININNIRKKKELNEFYIGNDSTIRNNNSTLVDANEYYLNILESQQLLVNSKLKKINNETDTNENINIQENIEDKEEENEENNNNIDNFEFKEINSNTEINNVRNNLKINELCVSKEQIRKITDKEKTKSSNSKKSDEILNTYSIEELKQKINTTLKRANLFFSKDVIDNYKQNILNNITNYSDINTNINDNQNINININEEINEKEESKEKEELNEIIENNIDNNNEEEKKELNENIKINNFINEEDIKKLNDIKIETKNINNNIQLNNLINEDNNKSNISSENNNTKEKNLTSLSHNYTSSNNNNNPNIKVKIAIEPRAVLNLVEIIKFIIQRKIFVLLYESYIKHAISQQYNIAFSFFVAICKQYPFKKIEEYYNYKTYNYAFKQLFKPFNKRNFKYFLDCFHYKKKILYLESLLTKMIKFKTIEKIYIYSQYFQEDDEEKAFKMIISKIIYTLIRPHLYEAFVILRNNIYQKELNNENKNDKDDSEVNFNISDEDEENISINNFMNYHNEIKDKNEENILNSNSENKELNEQEKIYDIKQFCNDNISDNSLRNHRRKNDSSLKMNTFIYESLDSDEKSSISVEPNSLDNDKLHQLKMLLITKNKNFENGIDDNYINNENDNDIDFEINNSSKKSEKSLQEIINNNKSGKNASKTLSDMMEENSNQNSIDNLKNILNNNIKNSQKEKENQTNVNTNSNIKNNSNSNSSINSIGSKEKIIKNDEITKMNNDTKDTKEITEDSNTININTNNKSDIKSSENTNEINSENKINKNIDIKNIQKKFDYDDYFNEENKENKDINKEEKSLIELNHNIPNNIPRNNLKSKLLKNYKIIEKSDDDEKMEIKEENKNNNEIKSDKKIKIPLIKIINDSNDSENKISKEESKELKTSNKFSYLFENQEQFTNELVNEIINQIIFTEIKNNKVKLLPNKKYKFDKFLKKTINNNNSSQSQNNSLTNSCNSAGNFRDSHKSHNLNQLSLHEDVFSLNDSLNSNYSVYSIFNKTIKDKKKEHSLQLYFNKICPKLISYLHKEIIKKYPRIYNNISLQKKNISEYLMISLVLQDAQMLRNNYKKVYYKENIEKIIDKKEILRNFAVINKKIRQEDNITSDNYYDNMINECIVETAIELIEKERFYGDGGEPLKWSSRTREISFKYGVNDAKKFADYICKNILKIIHNKIGLISDNYSYMNNDEINYEGEKRLLDTIKNDLNKNEGQWKNLEMEETQLKVESSEMILDQLYNEVIEILEHIQFNRASPELYQYKSIYACEEIPKLSFQQTTTEDMRIPEGEENDFMNI